MFTTVMSDLTLPVAINLSSLKMESLLRDSVSILSEKFQRKYLCWMGEMMTSRIFWLEDLGPQNLSWLYFIHSCFPPINI